MSKVFSSKVFPRFNEFDPYGILHHMTYFSWFEYSRYNFFKHKGLDLKQLFDDGYYFVLLQSDVVYHHMVDKFDEYNISCSIDEKNNTNSKIVLQQMVLDKNNKKYVSAKIVLAIVQNNKLKLKLPKHILSKLGENNGQ